ncbi:MAG: hypothetical protein R3F43_23570 [bacterium]
MLHPNPDKFNGTATFQAHGVKVVTSAQVAALIPAIHTQRHGRFYADHQPDYPNETPTPEVFGDATMPLSAGGVTVTAHVLDGPGCSRAHVVVTFDGHAFVGDLVASQHHGWLEIGETRAWQARLEEIAAWKPRFVHPGRGKSGSAALLAEMAAYLQEAIDRVKAARATEPDGKAAMARAIQAMEAAHPTYGYRYFLQIGVPAEWRRQEAGGQ